MGRAGGGSRRQALNRYFAADVAKSALTKEV
jgi:hypothetical protein